MAAEAIVLSPLDLVARFCALVPLPKFNLVRHFGVLAPGCPLRKRVVPKPPEPPINPLPDSPHSFVDQRELGFDLDGNLSGSLVISDNTFNVLKARFEPSCR